MHFRFSILTIIALSFCVLLTCSDKPSQPVALELDQPIDIGLNKTIRIDSEQLAVSFLGVNFDSRCAATRTCRWPGLAEIRLSINKGAADSARCDIAIMGEDDSTWVANLGVDTLGYEIRLLNLSPTPVAIHPITHVVSGAVSATIIISKTPAHKEMNSGPSRISELPFDSIPATDGEILSADIVADTVFVKVKVANPCARHYFELNLNPAPEHEGDLAPRFDLWLRHTSHSTICTPGYSEIDLRFDASQFKDFVNHAIGFGQEKTFLLREFDAIGSPANPGYMFSYTGPPTENNEPPHFAEVSPISVRYGQEINLEVQASDPEHVIPELEVVGLPQGATFEDLHNGTGKFQWKTLSGHAGSYDVMFVASDGFLADTLTVPVTVRINRAPSIARISPSAFAELVQGDTMTVVVYATDPEGDTLTYGFSGQPSGTKFDFLSDQSGVTVVVPTLTMAVGDTTFRVIVSDGIFSVSQGITVRVLPRPVPVHFLTADTNIVLGEGDTVYFVINAESSIPGRLTFEAMGMPLNCYLLRGSHTAARLDFAPSYRQHGDYSITVIVRQAEFYDTLNVTFTVIDRNSPPILSGIGSRGCRIGTPVSFKLSSADADSDLVTYTMAGAPAGATLEPTDGSKAKFSYLGSASDVGQYHITFVVSDNIAADSEEILFVVTDPGPGGSSLLPLREGNFWIYSWDISDTLRVEGTSTEGDMILGQITHEFGPLTASLRIKSDTLFSTFGVEFVMPHDGDITFPVHVRAEHEYYGDRTATILTTPFTVPAGTFYGCIKFTSYDPNPCYNHTFDFWMGTYGEEYIVAPGVGIIYYHHWYKDDCSFNSEFEKIYQLQAYHIESQ